MADTGAEMQAQCNSRPTVRSTWLFRKRLQVSILMDYCYHRFIYRHLMRFSHRFNWHHTRECHPMPGNDTLLVCDWCGLRYLKLKEETPGVIRRADTTGAKNG